MNKYTQIAKDLEEEKEEPTQPVTENKYQAIANEMDFSGTNNLKTSIDSAYKKTPMQAKEAINLRKDIPITTDSAIKNMDRLKQIREKESWDFSDLVKVNPSLSKWLEKPDNSAVAREEIEPLKVVESNLHKVRLNKKSKSFIKETKDSMDIGTQQLISSSYILAAAFDIGDQDFLANQIAASYRNQQKLRAGKSKDLKQYEEAIGKRVEGVDEGQSQVSEGVAQVSGSAKEYDTNKLFKGLKDFNDGVHKTVRELFGVVYEAAADPRSTTITSAESLMSSTPAIVSGLAGATVAGPVGLAAGTVAGGVPVETGASMLEDLSSKYNIDLSDEEAIKKALSTPEIKKDLLSRGLRKGITTATVDGLISMFAGRGTAKALAKRDYGVRKALIKGDKAAARTAMRAGSAKAVGETVKEIPVQMVGEGAGEFSGQAAKEKSLAKASLGEAAFEAVVSGPMAVTDVFEGTYARSKELITNKTEQLFEEYENAEQSIEEHDALVEAVEALEEAPNTLETEGAIQDLINTISGDGETSNVYFQTDDWDNYWDGKAENGMLKAYDMGNEVGAAYQEALATGSDIQIPIADLVAKHGGTAEIKELMEHVKTREDGLKISDATEKISTVNEEIKQLAQAAKDSTFGQFEEQREEIVFRIHDMLKDAGFKSKDARFQAELLVNQQLDYADQQGVDPLDFFRQNNLLIRREGQQVIKDNMSYEAILKAKKLKKQVAENKGLKPLEVSQLQGEARDMAEGAIEDEIETMISEIAEAVPGEKIFIEAEVGGAPEVSGVPSTFPEYYKGINARNKKDFEKIARSKKGKRYNRLRDIAIERLLNGYENQQSGQVEPDNEFRALLNMNDYGTEDAEVFTLFQGARNVDRRRDGQEALQNESETLTQSIPGREGKFSERIRKAARDHQQRKGFRQRSQSEYAGIDEEFSTRIADEFGKLEHNPTDPEVQEAYQLMIQETMEQWEIVKSLGIQVEIIEDGQNPYPGGSQDLIRDVEENNHIWLFLTEKGFGTETDITDNPLLQKTGEFIGDTELVANDIFRVVHDIFGHVKEHTTFGPVGEENAWQAHVRMYSPKAARAMTTETRGQNSYVNYGPNGVANRTNPENTIYADQKVGLLPEWVTEENQVEDFSDEIILFQDEITQEINQDQLGFYSRLEFEVEQMDFKAIPAKNLLARIRKLKGIKKEELHYSSIEIFLQEQDNKKVTKEEVLEVLKNNRIVLSEVRLADGAEITREEMGYEPDFGSEEFIPLSTSDRYLYDEEVNYDIERRVDDAFSKYGDDEDYAKIVEIYNEEVKDDEEPEIDSWEDIPESELEKVKESFGESYREIAEEYVDSEDNVYATYEVRDYASGLTIRYRPNAGDDDFIVDQTGDSLDADNLEEAKIQLQQYAIDEGYVDSLETGLEEAINEEGRDITKPLAEPKWEGYTVEGGDNYREFLVTLPNVPGVFTYDTHFDDDIKNYVVHIRVKDRTNEKGEKIFYIEELQSDWHQQARDEGYAIEEESERDKLKEEKNKLFDEREAIIDSEEYQKEYEELSKKAGEYTKEGNKLEEEISTLNKKFDEEYEKHQEIQDNLQEYSKYSGKPENPYNLSEEDLLETIYNFRNDLSNLLKEVLNPLDREIRDLREKRDTAYVRASEERRIATDKAWEKFNVAEVDDKIKEIQKKLNGRIADAPFKDTDVWVMLGIKRALRIAADEGYDKIAWTPGSVHAERWNTFTHVDVLKHRRVDEDNFYVEVETRDGNTSNKVIPENKLKAYFGQEMAAIIIKGEDGVREGTPDGDLMVLTPDNVKIDNMSLTPTYDRKMPGLTKEYLKKTLKVKDTKVGVEPIITDSFRTTRFFVTEEYSLEKAKALVDELTEGTFATDGLNARAIDRFVARVEQGEDVQDAAASSLSKTTAEMIGIGYETSMQDETLDSWSLELTDDLKQKVMGGQVLFQDKKRGQLKIGKDFFKIDLLENADPSTFLHESAHFFLEMMRQNYEAVMSGNFELNDKHKKFLEDAQVVLDYLEVDSFDQIESVHHEKWATSFEKYLMEGKAPSERLRTAFARFKVWLISVYKQLQNIQYRDENGQKTSPQLTDEVRGVMDRIVASEEEIDMAMREHNIKSILIEGETGEIEKKKRDAYQKMLDLFNLSTKEKMAADLMKQLQKERDLFLTDEYKNLRNMAEEELRELPVYKARNILSKGKDLNGKAIKMNLPQLQDLATEEQLEQLPKSYVRKTTGESPDTIANLAGYESSSQMIDELIAAPPLKDAAKVRATEQLKAKYDDVFLNDEMLEDTAHKFIHSDERSRLLQMELSILNDLEQSNLKEGVKKVARRIPRLEEVKREANAVLRTVKLKKLRPHLYRNAEIKNARLVEEAIQKGEYDKAFDAKQKELLNNELYRRSKEIRDNYEKSLKRFKKVNKKDKDIAKTRDINFVNAARTLLSDYGLFNKPEAAQVKMDQIAKYDPDVHEMIKSILGNISVEPKSHKEMSVEEFQEIADTFDAIYDLAKTSLEIEIDGKRMSKDQAVDELLAQAQEFRKEDAKDGFGNKLTELEEWKNELLVWVARGRRLESFVDVMDYKEGYDGAFRKYIWTPASEATDLYYEQLAKIQEEIIGYMDELKAKDKELTKRGKIKAPELGKGVELAGMEELLGALVHVGNESNKKKLLVGREWGTLDPQTQELDTKQWDAFLERMHDEQILKKEHWDFIQKLWDLNERLKPMVQKAHKQVFGFYFEEINFKEIETPFGVYKGGYAPAKTDYTLVKDAARREEIKKIVEDNPMLDMLPGSGGGGFGKNRVNNYNKPLKLSIGLITSHVDEVLRFAIVKPAVLNSAKVVTDNRFKEMIDEISPFALDEIIKPALTAADKNVNVNTPDGSRGKVLQLANRIKSNFSKNLFFAHFRNVAEQLGDLGPAMTRLSDDGFVNGMRDMYNAASMYMADRHNIQEMIRDKSKYMKTKSDNELIENMKVMQDVFKDETLYKSMRDLSDKHAFMFQSMQQRLQDDVVWLTAYNQSLANGKDESVAIRAADSIVRMTQNASRPVDVSNLQRNAALNLVQMFMGWFNGKANLNASNFQKLYFQDLSMKEKTGRALYLYGAGYWILGVYTALLKRLAAGDFDEDKDDVYIDDIFDVFFVSQLELGAMMIPALGPAAMAGFNMGNDKFYDDKVSASPVLEVIAQGVGTGINLIQAPFQEKPKLRGADLLMATGVATGIPIYVLKRPYDAYKVINKK